MRHLWAKWYVKVALAAVVVVVLAGMFFAWKATTGHSLTEDQVIALAEGTYSLPGLRLRAPSTSSLSSCRGSLVTTAKPPAILRGKTWRVTVAGPCGLKIYAVDDATGVVREEP